MNWGNRLLLVFVAFAGLISYMVYRCVLMPVNLVTSEYYKDELSYQDVIDATKNANALSTNTSIVQVASNVAIQLPDEMKQHPVKGTILFYCPSDISNDRHIELSVDTQAKQLIDIRKFAKGNYMVKIEWSENNKHYYAEKPFDITASN
jgi:hypothetical protein